MTCEPSLDVNADAHRKVCWDRGYVVRTRYGPGKKNEDCNGFWCSHPRFNNAYPRLILICTGRAADTKISTMLVRCPQPCGPTMSSREACPSPSWREFRGDGFAQRVVAVADTAVAAYLCKGETFFFFFRASLFCFIFFQSGI